MREIWKDIPGHEGAYQVSNRGRVRSLPRCVLRHYSDGRPPTEIRYFGKILSARAKSCGHLNVSLGAGNTKLVHRLVLLAFVGPPKEGQECLHKNGKPADNRLSNLKWGSRLENKSDERRHARLYGRRQGSTWLSVETIKEIKRELQNPDRPSQRKLAERYGVHVNTINNISRGYVHRWVNP